MLQNSRIEVVRKYKISVSPNDLRVKHNLDYLHGHLLHPFIIISDHPHEIHYAVYLAYNMCEYIPQYFRNVQVATHAIVYTFIPLYLRLYAIILVDGYYWNLFPSYFHGKQRVQSHDDDDCACDEHEEVGHELSHLQKFSLSYLFV